MTHIVKTEIGEGEDKIVFFNRLDEEQFQLYNELSVNNPHLTKDEVVDEVFKQIPINENEDNQG